MGNSEFFPFCPEGSPANGDLLDIADYAADGQRVSGFQPGLARRALINRALRQSSHMGAVLARFVADSLDVDVLDNGDVQALADQFAAAVTRFTEAVVKGEKGDPGDAATIAIGEVVTIGPFDTPEVINTGTAHNAVLTLKIPQGVQGLQGPPGDSEALKPGYQYFFSQL